MDYLPASYEELASVWRRSGEDFRDLLAATPEHKRIKLLVKNVSKRGKTIAHLLAGDGNLDCLIEVLSEEDLYKLLVCKTKGNETAFHFAAAKNQAHIFSSVAKALSGSPNKLSELLTAQDEKDGRTALHLIATEGFTESLMAIMQSLDSSIIYQLLAKRDWKGLTALHCAAAEGFQKIFELTSTSLSKNEYQNLLLAVDKNNCSVIHYAMKRAKHQKLVKDLLKALPTISLSQLLSSPTKDEDIPTAVHFLAKFGYETIIEYIIERFINLKKEQLRRLLAKQTKETRETPLHFSARAGQMAIFKRLTHLKISKKINLIHLLSIKDSEGFTVLQRATRLGHVDIVKYIAESLSNDDLLKLALQIELNSNSFLHIMIKYGSTDMFLALCADRTTLQQYVVLKSWGENALTTCNLDLQRKKQEIEDSPKGSMDEILTDVEDIADLQKKEQVLISEIKDLKEKLATDVAELKEVQHKLKAANESIEELMSADKETNTDADITGLFSVNFTPFSDSSALDSEEEFPLDYSPDETAPDEIFAVIHRLCKENENVTNAVTMQSSENWKEILVVGENVSSIQGELERALKANQKLQCFEVLYENKTSFTKEKLSLIVSKSRKMDNNHNWGDVRYTTSELIVKAEEKDKFENNRVTPGALFAVVPAHFVLNREQNTTARLPIEQNITAVLNNATGPYECDHHLSENINANHEALDADSDDEIEIRRTREGFEAKTSRRKYWAQDENDKDNKKVDLKQPILFCRRERILLREGIVCPVEKCRDLQAYTCHHMYMNDTALIPLELKDAYRFQETLQIPSLKHSIMPVESIDQLQQLHRDHRRIQVREKFGHLEIMGVYEEGADDYAHHLNFVLTSRSNEGVLHTLEGGHCGSLLYIRSRNGEKWRPLGMFVSKIEQDTNRRGFHKTYYQAIVLSQAFKDLEMEYPHRIGTINRFKV